MPTRIIKSAADREQVFAFLKGLKVPFEVSWRPGKHRSTEQNKLQRLWMNEIAEQRGDASAEHYRGYCKAHFGLPILIGESAEYKAAYDKIIRPLPYEQKIQLMQVPLDYAVTRLMTMGQKARYLDDIYAHFTGQGVQLTEPDG